MLKMVLGALSSNLALKNVFGGDLAVFGQIWTVLKYHYFYQKNIMFYVFGIVNSKFGVNFFLAARLAGSG